MTLLENIKRIRDKLFVHSTNSIHKIYIGDTSHYIGDAKEISNKYIFHKSKVASRLASPKDGTIYDSIEDLLNDIASTGLYGTELSKIELHDNYKISSALIINMQNIKICKLESLSNPETDSFIISADVTIIDKHNQIEKTSAFIDVMNNDIIVKGKINSIDNHEQVINYLTMLINGEIDDNS